jgi:hypothetical protein
VTWKRRNMTGMAQRRISNSEWMMQWWWLVMKLLVI